MLDRLLASGEETPLLFSCMLACPTMPLRNFYMRLESLKIFKDMICYYL